MAAEARQQRERKHGHGERPGRRRGRAGDAGGADGGRARDRERPRRTGRSGSRRGTPRPQTTPKRVSSTSRTPPSRRPQRRALGGRGLQRQRGERGEHARAGGDEQQRAGARGEGRRRRAPAPAPAVARSAGSQTSSSTASTPIPSAIAPYSTARATPKATDVTGPAFWSPSRSATLARRRRRRVADAEDEAAADRVRVGRDDAVGDGVAAVLHAVAQPDRDLVVAPAGVERLALLDLRAVGGEHAHRAEGDLDRLAEAQHDLARRRPGDRAALRRGALEQRVGVRGRGRGQQRPRASPARCAPSGSPGLRGLPAGAGVAAAADREDADAEQDQHDRGAPDQRRSAGRRPAAAPSRACRRSGPARHRR